jgi:riboflavin synthase
MFTGIIKAVAKVKKAEKRRSSLLLTIAKPAAWRLRAGDSVATDGVCLTVAAVKDDDYVCELMPETLRLTTFGKKVSTSVNLERALKLSDRVDGHFVLGHVDAIGSIAAVGQSGRSYVYKIKFPKKFRKLVRAKGSIAVDGISLTVAELGSDYFTVSLVSHTWRNTTLGQKRSGDLVNLEFDIIAKHLYA